MNLSKLLFIAAIPMAMLSCQKTVDQIAAANVSAKTILNVSYGTSPEQKMDIYLPPNRSSESTKVIIMIHGGAWYRDDKSDLSQYTDTMRKRLPDYAVFN